MNVESSRSHAIVSLRMEQTVLPAALGEVDPELRFLRSKLNLVDLAGSERQKETGSAGGWGGGWGWAAGRLAAGWSGRQAWCRVRCRCRACPEQAQPAAKPSLPRSRAGNAPPPPFSRAGQRLIEGIGINRGLFALGNMINALADGNHKLMPWRDSKLTKVLKVGLAAGRSWGGRGLAWLQGGARAGHAPSLPGAACSRPAQALRC
jgi:hypothetical protein